jgi:hypothetical protein
LIDVFLGGRVAPIQPPLEEMRKLIELAKLPLGIWGVLPRSDGRGVLVEFLDCQLISLTEENIETPELTSKYRKNE